MQVPIFQVNSIGLEFTVQKKVRIVAKILTWVLPVDLTIVQQRCIGKLISPLSAIAHKYIQSDRY